MIKRKDIYYADLGPRSGSEQGGNRPVIIMQNDIGNKFSKTVIVIPITSKTKTELPTHVKIGKGECGLKKESIILSEQIMTIDKSRLSKKIGKISDELMEDITKAVEISIGLRGKIKFKKLIKIYLNNKYKTT